MSRGRHSVAVIGILILVLQALPLAQKENDAFERGMRARKDKRWAEVVKQMLAAIQIQPKESTRKIRFGGVGFLGGLGSDEAEYLPHFFLGEAYFEQKQCARAVQSWAVSEQQGVVTGTEWSKLLQENSRACAAQGVLLEAEFKTATTAARQSYDGAVALGNRVRGLFEKYPALVRGDMNDRYDRARTDLESASRGLGRATDSRLKADFDDVRNAADRALEILRPLETNLLAAVDNVSRTDRLARELEQLIQTGDAAERALVGFDVTPPADLQSARTGALAQLGQARDRLTNGQRTQNPAVLEEGTKYAQTAVTTLTTVLEQFKQLTRTNLERQLGDAVKKGEEVISFLDGAAAVLDRLALERPTAATPELTAEREKLQKQIETQRGRFERARKAEDLAAVQRATRALAEAHTALDALITSFGPVTLRDRGVHAALEEGARQFLAGEYQAALTALNPSEGFGNSPLQQHVHLFRSAAHYALWIRSGTTDMAQRDAALAEAARSKQLGSTFQPNPQVFSPAFVKWFQQAGAENAEVPAAAPGQ